MRTYVMMILLAQGTKVLAGIETKAIGVSSETISINILLNADTVLCSSADYRFTELKVLVPGLRGLTAFDHTNSGVSAPCITSGRCKRFEGDKNGHSPSELIDKDKPNENVDVKIVLTEQINLDREHKYCVRYLVENVTTNIRGLAFYHQRESLLGNLSYERCEKFFTETSSSIP